MNTHVDVRAALPQVRVPTLVIQAADDRDVDVRDGRYLAQHIPNVKYVELSSGDHMWWVSHQDEIIGEVQYALTKNVTIKLNSGFGLTKKAPDFAPEVGILFSF